MIFRKISKVKLWNYKIPKPRILVKAAIFENFGGEAFLGRKIS